MRNRQKPRSLKRTSRGVTGRKVHATFVDLTERRKMEQDLRASEARFRVLTEKSSDMTLLISPEGTILYLSPSVRRIMGYEPGKLVGSTVFELVHSDDSNRLMVGWRQLLKEPERSREAIEARIRHADGTWHIHEGTVRNLLHDPAVAAIVMNTRDITERKQVEEALRESEQKLKAVVYGSPIPQFVIDRNHTVIYWNNALQEITGIKAEQVVGTKEQWRAFYSEERSCLADLLIEGRTGQIPEWYRGKHSRSTLVDDAYEATDYFPTLGKEGKWLHFTAATIKDPEGNVIGAVETLEDITERKAAEEALRESESRYRALFDNASDAILIHDIGGKFLEANHVACERLGYIHEEFLQMTPEDINSPEYAAHVTERVEDLRKRGHAFFEIAHMRRDGTVIPIELSSRIIEYKGKPAVLSIARDITERKRMQQELERYSKQLEEMVSERTKKLSESESRFRELSDLLPQIVFEIGENGNLQFMNRAAFAATGCTEEDFRRGLNAFQLFASEDHDRAMGDIRRIIAGEMIGGHEFTVLRRDGTSFPVLVYTAPIMREGKAVGLRGIAIDITERKRMEEELRSTKERLEYVVTSNPAAIYSGKPLPDLPDWELTYLSENVSGILGYEAREFVGHPEFWRRIVHPEDRPSVLAEMPRLWETGRSTIEYRMRDKNGDYRWIREEANAVRDASGKPIEVNGYWTDITARKQAEQALRESEDRYRRLFESSPISLWEEDFSDAKKYLDDLRNRGVKDFRNYFMEHPEDVARCSGLVKILDVNRATLELYNAENVRDFVGGLSKLITKEALDTFREEIVALAEGKTRFESEFINQTLAGERKQISLIVNVIPGYEDTLAKVLVSILDLTEFKLMEERLLRSERLAAIGETAAMVGHDLRNPLQAMTGSLYLAKKLSRSERVEERKEAVKLLDTVDDQILYMDKIVSDLQSYAGPVGAEPVETNLPNLVREAISNAQVPGNVETHVEVQEDLTSVVVDSTLLQRVLSNLIMNAVQAMPKGGNLTVTAHKEQESLTVTVQDAGEGIARENMDKIFNPFFTTKAKGQGLGLAVCRRLVEAQNGTIAVTSEVGKGSTFTLKIPTSRMSGAV